MLLVGIAHLALAAEVPIDPIAGQPEIDPAILKEINVVTPGEIVFADGFGPFVMLGTNKGPRDVRRLCSLKEGKVLGTIAGRFEIEKPFALDPQARYFAAWRGSGANTKVAIFTTKGQPFAELVNPSKVEALQALSDKRLAVTHENSISIWDVSNKKLATTIPLPKRPAGAGKPIISPNGKLVILFDKAEINCLDDAGKAIGTFTLPKLEENEASEGYGAALHADGKQLAVWLHSVRHNALTILDLSTGKFTGPFFAEEMKAQIGREDKLIDWSVKGDALLLRNRFVVDPECGKVLWELPAPAEGLPLRGLAMARLFNSHTALSAADGGGPGMLAMKASLENEGRIADVIKDQRAGPPITEAAIKRPIAPPDKPAATPPTEPAPMANARVIVGAQPAVRHVVGAPQLASLTATSLNAVREIFSPAGPVAITFKPGDPLRWNIPQKPPLMLPISASCSLTFVSSGQLLAAETHDPKQPIKLANNAQTYPTKSIDYFKLGDSSYARQIEFNMAASTLAISPDGNLLAITEADRRGRIDLIDAETGKGRSAFLPYGPELTDIRLQSAVFLDNERLLTDNGSKLVVWRLADVKPELMVKVKPHVLALSADRKLVVIAHEEGVRLIDPATLMAIGDLAIPKGEFPEGQRTATSVNVSPNGNLIAAVFHVKPSNANQTYVAVCWDLATGKHIACCKGIFHLMQTLQSGSIVFPGEGFLLINHQWLLSLKQNAIVWRFDGQDVVPALSPDGRIWYTVSDEKINKAVFVNGDSLLPDVVRWLDTFDHAAPELMRPGEKIVVRVQLNEENEAVQREIEARLVQRGLKIDPQSPLQLTVSVRENATGKSTTFGNLRPGNGNPGTQTLNIVESVGSSELTCNGTSLWKAEYRANNDAGSGFLEIPQGQTIEQIYNRKMRASIASSAKSALPVGQKFYQHKDGIAIMPGRGLLTTNGTKLFSPIAGAK